MMNAKHIRGASLRILILKLLKMFSHTPLIGLLVVKHSDSTITYFTVPNLKEFSLDKEIQLAANERLIENSCLQWRGVL